ncbi:peptidase G2 autoproteolytic cleavage domain-containing protein [Chengkuizengella sp. SCS-71B]
MEKRQELNPEYDPDKQYVPRSERPEWEAGMQF